MESELLRIFALRNRWLKDGKKKYGYGDDQQHYWDNYHDALIEDEKRPGVYFANIQTYDSPEGDRWYCAYVKFEHGRVEILKQWTDVS